MKIAVSGASGFVGAALLPALELRGHEVRPIVRARSDSSPDSNAVLWDPLSGLIDPDALNGFDALIHLAGKSIASGRWTAKVKREIQDSRVRATQIMMAQVAQLQAPPKTIVSASAVGLYGNAGDQILDESSSPGQDFLAEVAVGWESACDPVRSLGLRVVHPRLGIVLGEHGGALQKMLPLFRYGLGGKLGSGSQYWSWISLVDCVSALVWMVETETATGPYNLVSPEPLTNAEFTKTLATHLHRPAFVTAPAFGLRLAMGEMADALLLASCRAVPKRLLEQGFMHQHATLAEYLAEELS